MSEVNWDKFNKKAKVKMVFRCLIFLPALMFWVPFCIFFSIANRLIDEPDYFIWHWLGIFAQDMSATDKYAEDIE